MSGDSFGVQISTLHTLTDLLTYLNLSKPQFLYLQIIVHTSSIYLAAPLLCLNKIKCLAQRLANNKSSVIYFSKEKNTDLWVSWPFHFIANLVDDNSTFLVAQAKKFEVILGSFSPL